MMYALDSNVFIESNRAHFPISEGLFFWDWLVELGKQNLICTPAEVYDEICKGTDELPLWIKTNRSIFVHATSSYINYLGEVMEAYHDPTFIYLEKIAADPYLIALAKAKNATVVTGEKPSNAITPPKMKIPSVCKTLGVPCITLSRFLWNIRENIPKSKSGNEAIGDISARKEMAIIMLSCNEPMDKVVKYSGLTIDQVQKLKAFDFNLTEL